MLRLVSLASLAVVPLAATSTAGVGEVVPEEEVPPPRSGSGIEAAEVPIGEVEEEAVKLPEGEKTLLAKGSSFAGLETKYDGVAWPAMDVPSSYPEGEEEVSAMAEGEGEGGVSAMRRYRGGGAKTHVFAIGDWGTLLPGRLTAPNVRPMGSKNQCPHNCDYVPGIDDRAQLLVASAMKARAGKSNPQYVLNAGDSFYWGGITQSCGAGTRSANGKTIGEFAKVWTSVYGGLTGKPWIGCLGNHDYGGWQFNMGWDQQIAYSFTNRNWVMPARYFSRLMRHPGFTVEYFVIDSNAFDAWEPAHDPEHNICSAEHNPPGASCASVGGPSSAEACKGWFWSSYYRQKAWLEGKLARSKADWKVVITHFPCGHEAAWYAKLHRKFGLDLLVTGHRHDQELWKHSGTLGGLTCIVTGGGGGVTSESAPSAGNSQYGFFDLAFSKSAIEIALVNFNGLVTQSGVVSKGRYGGGGKAFDPKPSPPPGGGGAGSCADYGCGGFDKRQSCQCNAACKDFGSCCDDYSSVCQKSRGGGHDRRPRGGSCAAYGCGGFDRSQSCQCNSRCHSHGNCCSDYRSKCRR